MFSLKAIIDTIDDFGMLESGDRVLAAVSGGGDSIFLARSLMALQNRYGIKVGIAHINHMLRDGESLRDELFVEKFAEKSNLPFYSRKIDVKRHAKKNGLSIEQSGREVRYRYLNQISDEYGYTKIATGHNNDDNAELVLMNLLRGSGTRGLSGIPPVRDKIYIRPLIRFKKKEILHLLESSNQEYVFDSSNNDTSYLRNKIRHKLIPMIQSEYNPEIVNALNRLSSILKIEEDFFNIETEKEFNRCLLKRDASSVSLLTQKLSDLHPAVVHRVLRRTIKTVKNNLDRITLGHITDMTAFCVNASSGKSLDLPDQIRVYKERDVIIIKKEKKPLRDIGRKKKLKTWAVKNQK